VDKNGEDKLAPVKNPSENQPLQKENIKNIEQHPELL